MAKLNRQADFHCTICNKVVTRARFRQYKVCKDIPCVDAYRRQCRTQEEALQKRKFVEAARNKDRAFALGFENVTIVPASISPVVPALKSRHKKLIAHVKNAIREAVALPSQNSGGDAFDIETLEDSPNQIECNACHACGGWCCNDGGEHAYLKPEFIKQVLNKNPDLSPAELFRRYIRALPKQSVEDSCVFHGPQGCTMERRFRSHTCNTYRCRALVQLLESGKENVTIVANDDQGNFTRVYHDGKVRDF